MRRSSQALSLLLGLLVAPALSAAQGARHIGTDEVATAGDEGGPTAEQEGALFLLLPIGAQGVGLARAMTAVASAESAFWNPAGLAGLDRGRVLLFHGDHLSGDGTGVSFLLPPSRFGVLGVSYSLLDSGTQDITDDTGTVLGSITVRSHQAILSAASGVGSWLDAGLNVKWVQFRLGCRGQCPDAAGAATSYAVDAGLLVRPLGERLAQLGIMLAHVGPGLRARNLDESNPLPARVRVAASYAVRSEIAEQELLFRLVAEGEDRLRALGDPSFFLGTEIVAGAEDRVYIRGGYVFGSLNETYGAAIGLGLVYERFELAVSRELARGGPALEQEPVHLTLGVAL